MNSEKELLTNEERVIVEKLETEMSHALTLDHIIFYKNEIKAIFSHAKRRKQFLLQYGKSAFL